MDNEYTTSGFTGSFYKMAASFAQQRLWFLDRYESDSSHYNVSRVFRLRGTLNQEALTHSINEIIRRHEVMRTIFVEEDGVPIQLISPQLTLRLPVVDLCDLPEQERYTEAERLVEEELRYAFNLEQGPLLRYCLLQLGELDHILILTIHHIITDAWSITVLNKELMAFYNAYVEDKSPSVTDLPIQYADFSLWQRDWLQDEVLEKQLGYWREQLTGVPMLNLPADRLRPAVRSFAGASQRVNVSATLTEALRQLSQAHKSTLFMTFLASFQLLLHRVSHQDDIAVGSPIAGRNRREIEPLIGFFVNTLIFRTNLSGNPTFGELLERVREVCLGGYAHQDLPFEKLVEELNPERDLSHNPFFDVLINFTDDSFDTVSLQGLDVELLEFDNIVSKFPLTLYISPDGNHEGLELKIVYQTAIFSPDLIRCVIDQYRYLLEQIVTSPDQSIDLYSLVTPETKSLLPEPTLIIEETPYDTVVKMFLVNANDNPSKIAIDTGSNVWTYAELMHASTNLAIMLHERGFGDGDVIAVTGQRSIGLITSVMGVLMCGGVLLLIDDNLPNERKKLILSESSAKILLSITKDDENESLIDLNACLPIINISCDDGSFTRPELHENVLPHEIPFPSPDSAAYIFFTSGSTGVPKAVLGCHKSLSHFINWQRKKFGVVSDDRVSQLTGLSFDVILRDIFLPLCSGGTLCIPTDKDMLDIPRWLERQSITVLHTVPTVVQSWLADIHVDINLSNLRYVFLAGEPLMKSLVEKWRAAFPDSGEIINLYGATETTLVKCFYPVPQKLDTDVQPIGCPLPQTQVLILSAKMQLCGIGEPGEIVIRTPYRSMGYVNFPEENKKRFVKNPFRNDSNDILYFTGDSGRYRPDGMLEYLGRLDDQVKIRGVRVEPSEVTAILSRHPVVKACAIIALKDEVGQYYLVAYVASDNANKNISSELTTYLKRFLPSVMLPATYVFLEQLPVLPNGKIDRRALPEPERNTEVLAGTYKAPRNEVEQGLVTIWEDVLRLDRVGIHDDFFEIGGHSLLATRIISRINHAFTVEIPLRVLFEEPTIEKLTVLLKKYMHVNRDTRIEPIPRLTRKK